MLYLLLQAPPVQRKITSYLTTHLSDRLKTVVKIGGVDIELFSWVVLKEVYIEDRHSNVLLKSGEIKISPGRMDFDNNRYYIDELELSATTFNMVRYQGEEDFNYQFIIDSFSGKDTSTTLSENPPVIIIQNVSLKGVNYSYQKEGSSPVLDGMDYNDIQIRNISGRIRGFTSVSDSISLVVSDLRFIEKSGFTVRDFDAVMSISPRGLSFGNINLKSGKTELRGNVQFLTDSFSDYSDFISKVRLKSSLRRSYIKLSDLQYFSSDLKYVENAFYISGDIKGTVDNLKGRDLSIAFGKASTYRGDLDFEGLPEINETYVHFNIRELKTNKNDLEIIPLPPFEKRQTLDLPENFSNFGNIEFNGSFTGFFNDFVAYGKFKTAIGSLSTDISLHEDTLRDIYKYNGKISTNDLNIGVLSSSMDNIGRISLNADIKGEGFTLASVDANVDGEIKRIEILGYNYKNLIVSGDFKEKIFKGSFNITEENIDLDFQGSMDFSKPLPVLNFSSEIRKIYPVRLNLVTYEKDFMLSALMNVNMIGDNIDNMTGNIDVEKISYKDLVDSLLIKSVNLSSSFTGQKKTINLTSDAVNGYVTGTYKILQLPEAFKEVVTSYLPAIGFAKAKVELKDQIFNYQINLAKISEINRIFYPKILLANNSSVSGSFNSNSNEFGLYFKSPLIRTNGYKLVNAEIKARAENDAMIVSTSTSRLFFNDTISIDRVSLNSVIKNDSISLNLAWDKDDTLKYTGDINIHGKVKSADEVEFSFGKSEMVFFDTLWTIDESNKMYYNIGDISFNNLVFESNHNQFLKINGVAGDDEDDVLKVEVSNFRLSNANLFTSRQGLRFDGVIDGTASFKSVTSKMLFDVNTSFTGLVVNGENFGNGTIKSSWDPLKEAVQLQGEFYRGVIPTIAINGFYYPKREKDQLDFRLDLQKTQLQLFSLFVKDFITDLKGLATGSLTIQGTVESPEITGKLALQKTGFLINFLNTHYTFSHEISFSKSSINFDDLTIFDSKGNSAIVHGAINHNSFKNFIFDIQINANNLFCLNTNLSHNSSYYGDAYATGLIKIAGPVDNVKMDISAKTEKGTKIFIPLEGSEEISESSFIRFVKKDSVIKIDNKAYQANLTGIQLNFELEITPDAEFQLIFDSKVGDIIKGNGHGNIKMEINTLGKFNMYGDYIIQEGEYLLTLQNVINKHFTVQNGGTIIWNGDPMDAEVNITAVYKLRTNLSELFPQDTSDVYKKRIPVEAILVMTDKLINPNIEFRINLPTADEQTRLEVANIIGKENLQQQVFSLLILNRFYPSGSYNSAARISDAKSSGSELLSSQLSNWLSQNFKNVDVGINYRPGDEVNRSRELEVALSTQLFNDKLLIDGNVGNVGANQSSSSAIVGDATVEYKISKDGKLRVKAFHKTNDNNLLNSTAATRQGVGLSYREEFNTWSELMRNIKAKFFRRKEEKARPEEEKVKPVEEKVKEEVQNIKE